MTAAFEAVFREHKLAVGEQGAIVCLSPTQPQARLILEYARGFLRASPTLAAEIESETVSEIRLRNNVTISVNAASFRNLRGRTILCAIYDECAYWRSDDEVASANPDVEIHRAVAPALAASGGRLVAISSPYRRVGLLHSEAQGLLRRRQRSGACDPGREPAFQPASRSSDDRCGLRGRSRGRIERMGAEFRSDLAAFMDDELVDACVDRERPRELAPVKGRSYVMSPVDPSRRSLRFLHHGDWAPGRNSIRRGRLHWAAPAF